MSSNSSNRIGEQLWFRLIVLREGIHEWRRGILRMWSVDYEEFESGPGNYPVGVIEDCKTGDVRSIHVDRLSFANDKPAIPK